MISAIGGSGGVATSSQDLSLEGSRVVWVGQRELASPTLSSGKFESQMKKVWRNSGDALAWGMSSQWGMAPEHDKNPAGSSQKSIRSPNIVANQVIPASASSEPSCLPPPSDTPKYILSLYMDIPVSYHS